VTASSVPAAALDAGPAMPALLPAGNAALDACAHAVNAPLESARNRRALPRPGQAAGQSPRAVTGDLVGTDTFTAQNPATLDRMPRSADFYLATNGDLSMATDTRRPKSFSRCRYQCRAWAQRCNGRQLLRVHRPRCLTTKTPLPYRAPTPRASTYAREHTRLSTPRSPSFPDVPRGTRIWSPPSTRSATGAPGIRDQELKVTALAPAP
jgi:hypothetical protein